MRWKWTLLLMLFSGAGLAQELPYELQATEVVSVNRMPMRAHAFRYESLELAKSGEKERSENFLPLNGYWKFHWVQDPRKRPVDFYKTEFDEKGWTNFPVPANWELNGFGLPIYLNQPYEFTGHAKMHGKLDPPYDIPVDNNPVGSYRKKFLLPADWKDKQIFIHLGAVKSAFFIWVNGKKVGYSEDSKLAAEFDITSYVQPGENLVALQVYRWSDGSYLECQDMWRISGIERDVYLYATPKIDIFDFKVEASLENNYKDGRLKITGQINNAGEQKGWHSKYDTVTIEYLLTDQKGGLTFNEKHGTVIPVLRGHRSTISFDRNLHQVNSWSAEIPYLYTLYLILRDKMGNVLEVIPQRIGFRNVEIKDRNVLVNGKRVLFKGVNRHEHHPKTGHVLSKADMRKDMEMMKKLNINAVRHSHYPPDPYWLELCDEYGLYVIDEANIESHGRGYDLSITLGNDKQWLVPHMSRITRMYERDKNFTSVITWSMGNEGGNGYNFYEGYEWLKKMDSRPVQYERAELDYNTDIFVPQYPAPQSMARYSRSDPARPMIMSEYAHIMGNSLGNFKDYWDTIEAHPYLQGGFIWEWIDQSIDTVNNGKRIKAYGGDFPLEGPVDHNLSDNNFCVKGVVTAYRELTPMAIEIKKVLQPIKTVLADSTTVRITNAYHFRDIKNVKFNWELVQDGVVVESGGGFPLDIGPQDTKTFPISMKTKKRSDKEYFLNVRYTLIGKEPFLPANYEIAFEQLSLKNFSSKWKPALTGGVRVETSGNRYKIEGKDFSVVFEKGLLTSYSIKGEEWLSSGPKPSFWRAPTDNDIGSGFNKSLRMWRNAYDEGKLVDFQMISSTPDSVRVVITKELVGGDAETMQTFTVFSDGSIRVQNEFIPKKGKYPLLMRVGNDLVINKTLRQIEWYGRGPGENYWDRKSSSMVGRYTQSIDDQYYPYARPQESGNKTDTRWVKFTNSKGKGIMVMMADTVLNFSALPYHLDDLDPEVNKKQYHSGELVKRDEIYLHVDLQQTGVQGIDSWGAWPLEKYRIPYMRHQYSYYIIPIK